MQQPTNSFMFTCAWRLLTITKIYFAILLFFEHRLSWDEMVINAGCTCVSYTYTVYVHDHVLQHLGEHVSLIKWSYLSKSFNLIRLPVWTLSKAPYKVRALFLSCTLSCLGHTVLLKRKSWNVTSLFLCQYIF